MGSPSLIIYFMRLFFLLCLFLLGSCKVFATPLKVLVSIAPTKYLVERIGQDKVAVDILVPSAASPHTYEPTLRQMIDVNKAQVWFRSGEGFEKRAVDIFQNKMKIVDLREGVDLLPFCCQKSHNHDRDAHDSHTWLSLRCLAIQALHVERTLSELIPESKDFFKFHLEHFLRELSYLDEELRLTFSCIPCRTVLVSHPAFGYFCRDYGLHQVSIEVEGKEPTAKEITSLMKTLQYEPVKKVFIQPQYLKKGAQKVAKEMNLHMVTLDPYEENVLENIKTIAKAFSE